MWFQHVVLPNQEATTFCDCQPILSKPRGSGKELACSQHRLSYTVLGPFHMLPLCLPLYLSSLTQILEGYKKKEWRKKRRRGRGGEGENTQLVKVSSVVVEFVL